MTFVWKPAIRQTWKSAVHTWPFAPMGAIVGFVPNGAFEGTAPAETFMIKNPINSTPGGSGSAHFRAARIPKRRIRESADGRSDPPDGSERRAPYLWLGPAGHG